MDAPTEMPKLAYPFAVVGGAAGWLSAHFLDNPLVGFTPSHAEELAAASTAAIAGLVGFVLHRRCAPRAAWLETSAVWVQLGIAVLIGGAVSGALVGGLGFGNLQGMSSGTLAGLGAAVAFMPVCALVVSAARRAARARLGSLVADADRREMWGILIAALAITTCAGFADGFIGKPSVPPVMMAAVAAGATMALLGLDVAARLRLGRVASAADAMELREADMARTDDPDPDLDFGLGDEVRARMARGAAAYRATPRATALVIGSPERARAALGQAMAKKTVGLLLVAAVIAGHCVAPYVRLPI